MTSYFIRRILLTIPTFLGITIIFFFVLQIVPGGPLEQEIMKLRSGMANMGGAGQFGATSDAGVSSGGGSDTGGMEIPAEAMEEMKKFYGMDKPIHMRYIHWLWNVVQLDLGTSYYFAEPVWDLIKSRMPISIYFGFLGFFISYSICIPLGVAKAIKHGSPFDTASSILVFVGYSIPGWAFGAILLVLLGGGSFWDVFPLGEFTSENYDSLNAWDKFLDKAHHTVLPAIAWTITSFATMTVLMKNSLMENMGQDYVRTAFAKGLGEKRVIFVHAMRNSLIPLATGIGNLIGLFLAGSYMIEKTFNINGMGLLSYNAILQRDYPIALGFLVFAGIIRLFGNLISDVVYAVVDPRIRFK
ncbi:MAG: ABC transporter permease subunit [Calditrichaeota bacterium]|nr:ABC transporter permease subunit [Calditrichota bacterium]MBT7618365.1 ABC transporter permease subunit [Calditrichota bacterium]MBT7790084.1 ABC transporter permease subunit [Calditrichota bacterium]